MLQVLVPPEIKTEKRMLKVRVFKALHLPKMDAFSDGADGRFLFLFWNFFDFFSLLAFVEVKYAGITQRTNIVKSSAHPVWK